MDSTLTIRKLEQLKQSAGSHWPTERVHMKTNLIESPQHQEQSPIIINKQCNVWGSAKFLQRSFSVKSLDNGRPQSCQSRSDFYKVAKDDRRE